MELDATFELSAVPVFELVYHHKAGGRGTSRSVNADYHEGLEVLLRRLASVNATVLGISLDSRIARELDPEDRELDLMFPIHLRANLDIAALRLDITRAQKSVARRETAKAGGGNDQRRIRITLTVDALDYGQLLLLLEGSHPAPLGAASARSPTSAPAAGRGDREPRARRALPRVRDLMEAGILPPGTVVSARVGDRAWTATLLSDGRALLAGATAPELFGKLTDRLAGHSESAMRMWSTERDGRMVRLSALRDELAAAQARDDVSTGTSEG